MNILILNSILYTPDGEGNIPRVQTIKDTMIYGMCLGFLHLGHSVTLASVEDYRPMETELYDFEVRFFKTEYKRIFQPSVLPYSSEMKQYLKRHHKDFDKLNALPDNLEYLSACAHNKIHHTGIDYRSEAGKRRSTEGSRKSKYKDQITKEKILDMQSRGMNITDIAKELQCGVNTVRRRLGMKA